MVRIRADGCLEAPLQAICAMVHQPCMPWWHCSHKALHATELDDALLHDMAVHHVAEQHQVEVGQPDGEGRDGHGHNVQAGSPQVGIHDDNQEGDQAEGLPPVQGMPRSSALARACLESSFGSFNLLQSVGQKVKGHYGFTDNDINQLPVLGQQVTTVTEQSTTDIVPGRAGPSSSQST
eukprot:355048-Chlamydomonas_euryale.AAC.2